MISIQLSDPKQVHLLQQHLDILTKANAEMLSTLPDDIRITAFVDGRGLACPMPLLKTKVALKSMAQGDSVYVLASDPNSPMDLSAFCAQNGLIIALNTLTSLAPTPAAADNLIDSVDSLEKLDTIFHLIITKTHGN